MPEGTNTTLHSLLRGYAVIAVSSKDREGKRIKCWQFELGSRAHVLNASDGNTDWERVRKVLRVLLPRLGLDKLPLLGVGISSGATFLLSLPLVMPGAFAAIIPQLPVHAPDSLLTHYEDARAAGAFTAPFPPTYLVDMPKDTWVHNANYRLVQAMRRMGMQVVMEAVHPVPVTPLYMAQRCGPEINESTSRAIRDTLRKQGYIDEQGYVLYNPRHQSPSWRAILLEHAPEWMVGVRLTPEASPLSAEMNVCYGAHGLSSEVMTGVYDWFERIQRKPAPGVSAG